MAAHGSTISNVRQSAAGGWPLASQRNAIATNGLLST
jgi:hypothetical protein